MARRPPIGGTPARPGAQAGASASDSLLQQAMKLLSQGKSREALPLVDRALRREPSHPQGNYLMAVALCAEAKYDRALFHAERAESLLPNNASVLMTLGQVQGFRGEYARADDAFRRSIAIDANRSESWEGRGLMLRRLQRVDEAEACLRRAIELGPNRDGCWVNLGLVLLETARVHEATDHLRLGSERFAQSLAAQQKWAYALLHDDRATADDLLTAHRRWGRIVEAAVRPTGPGFPVDRDRDRTLRVAYLSPDLHQHSVAYFLEPLMRAHDRERVQVYAYDTGLVHDDTTTRLQGVADHWRPLKRARDRDIVDRVDHDRIDVLVELTGHYSNNRLTSLARRLTPVQVTYLGYPATTGLTRIDARLVDSRTDPVDPERADPATERLVRLDPCFLCYSAPPKAPAHDPTPPVTRGSPFTFGSFNNLKKVGPWVVDAWAEILKRCDGARLLLKGRGYDDPGVRERLASGFEARGVEPDRIRMIARTSTLEEHFAMYHEVDCALDTFPYNGTTTTCEAAWMGVPTLTTRGAHHAARVGVSLNAVMGLEDFTLDTPEALVDRAADLFADPKRLVDLRPGLRDRMLRSPLMDAPAFARRLEDTYRQLWHAYLDSTSK